MSTHEGGDERSSSPSPEQQNDTRHDEPVRTCASPPEGPATSTEPGADHLESGLKPRHVTMISIAGVIGAGLFVGSANAIKLAGPAAIISYAAAGLVVVLVMRMLGEMATVNPDTGSFSVYADRALGKWAGFSIGWLYWWAWALIIPVEATAGATILTNWIDWPQWVFAFLITAILTATNLVSVGNYGEFEFWFALVKVVVIIAFIAVGLLAILGLLPTSDVSGLSGLTANGFFGDGLGGIFAAMLTTTTTYLGTEIVTIAAAESKNPVSGIRRAVNSVIWRISIFYLGSIFVVVALVNWRSPQLAEVGSYQFTLETIGLGQLTTVLDLAILTAVASCLNSALYTASRMAFSLGQRGDAPGAFGRTNSRGVPVAAILASVVVGFVCVGLNYVLPDKIFGYLLSTAGCAALFVYLCISFTQLRSRRAMDAAGVAVRVRMWLFPGLTYATIAFIVLVLVMMAFDSEQSQNLWFSLAVAAVVLVASFVRHGFSGGSDREIVEAAEEGIAETSDSV
ncbi:amino acid permease [Dermacoccus sp. 147Ba]|uniref:Amino acid permease n=1 Tax=Dermacoccus abyssi TaxID=322596 RepID=A0ABX5ZCB6_9MICO|nr:MULTISPECIES: amino acid permease [Dermacoccus]QEH94388.1 amino acid permease [Dermacoccus abyssi]RYI21444.1 amino acid permease [Dermacoccus sp. 147Ba]